jgi:hypothetical protein
MDIDEKDKNDEKPKNNEKEKRAPRRGFLPAGCVGALGIGVLIVGSIFACGFLPVFLGGIFLDQRWFVPGSASSFDPIALYPEILQYAGTDNQLIYMQAKYVRSDGTLDLYANYDPEVYYYFAHEIEPPGGRKPIGVGSAPEGSYYETVSVSVDNDEFPFTMDRSSFQSTTAEDKSFVSAPACSFADLWEIALERGAPQSAVASIYYDDSGYRFSIDGTSTNITFDVNCKVIR